MMVNMNKISITKFTSMKILWEKKIVEGVSIIMGTTGGQHLDEGGEQNLNTGNYANDNEDGDGEEPLLEIFDPTTWDKLDNKTRDILIGKGLMSELDLQLAIDNLGRHFS
jgi:ABC-type lipoprotein release transport system permease subunit